MGQKKIGILIVLFIVSLMVLLPVFGCAGASTSVAKPDKVTLYCIGDLSGPIAAVSNPEVNGVKDYLEWLNAEKKGIDGVPVELVYRDTNYKLDQTLAAYSSFREASPKPLVLWTFASGDTEALRDRVNEDKIVNFAQGTSTAGLYPVGVGYTFGSVNFYPDAFGVFIDWLVNDWSKKTGQKPKLAYCTWDAANGRAIMVEECLSYAKDKGVEVVAQEVFGMRELDVTTQLTKIKAAGANWVMDNCAGVTPALISKNAKALGMLNTNIYDTTPGMIHRSCTQTGIFQSVIDAAPAEMEGFVGVANISFFSEKDKQGVKLAAAMADKKGLKASERNENYLIGWMSGAVMVEAVNRAVNAVGWGKLDGTAVKEQFDKMKDYSALDLSKYTYAPGRPQVTQARIITVKNGVGAPLTGEWLNCPDLRPAKYK